LAIASASNITPRCAFGNLQDFQRQTSSCSMRRAMFERRMIVSQSLRE
jgi:hypothetical protein